MNMELRRTSARSESCARLKLSKRRRVSLTETTQARDEDVFFTEITPFSPLSEDPRNENDENEQVSNLTEFEDDLSYNNSGDEDFEQTARKSKRKKTTGKRAKNKTQAPARKFLKEENLCDIGLSDIVADKSIIEQVEKILNVFPDQFIKGYCRYVFEEQRGDKSETALKKRWNWRLFLMRDDPNKCVICGEKLEHLTWDHLKEHEGSTGFTCVCGKTSKNVSLFYEHITRVHAGECFCCPYCNKKFASGEQIEQHLRIDHHQDHRYVCAVCKKGFDKEIIFLDHINSHTGLRPYECSECDKKYRYSADLREHRSRHHSNVQVACSVCGKEFVSQKLLKTHSLIHGELRKYACDICGKAYKTKQNLVNHQSFHSTKKAFTCPDCGSSYSSKNIFNNHLRLKKHGPHARKNEDGKAINDEVLLKKESLAKKTKAEKIKKAFPCTDCDRSYAKRKGLSAHFKLKNHGPYSEKINNESVYVNSASNENSLLQVSEDSEHEDSDSVSKNFEKEFTRKINYNGLNTKVLPDEGSTFEFISCEINKQPLLLDKRIVVDDNECESDEETGLFICL